MNTTRASNGHGVNGVSGACTPRVESGTADAQRNQDAQDETRCPRPTRSKSFSGTGDLCAGPAGASTTMPTSATADLVSALRVLAIDIHDPTMTTGIVLREAADRLSDLAERDGWTRVDPQDRGTLPDAETEVCVRDTDGGVFRGAYYDEDQAWDVAGRFPVPVRAGQQWIDLPDEE